MGTNMGIGGTAKKEDNGVLILLAKAEKYGYQQVMVLKID
jgi:hypothetical protein